MASPPGPEPVIETTRRFPRWWRRMLVAARRANFYMWLEIAAAVVLKPGADKSAAEKELILKYLKDSVAPYKVPKVIEFMDELPTSGVGKVLKRELKKKMT
jgi:non-ribosomal peptide synthetase component E (peptide arylation enzyme)